ncbi:MAG: Inactivated superfamily I helicase [Denitromonas halophila]|nr:MAG: Inactivated superfamily I helicase [Denitromonas halophila]TVT75009.1 MAG: Inactivated superfamily I helicase [Denitromonas halophila]
MIGPGLTHHRFAPGLDFIDRCAAALIDRAPGPDLTGWRVVVPNLMMAPAFKQALRRAAGRSLLLPPVETLQVHLAPWAATFSPLSDTRRQFALYQQLRARGWFENGNLWALCEEFIALFDELTEQGAGLAASEDALAAQLAAVYGARNTEALRFEAAVVHQLWYAETQGAPSRRAARFLGAAQWTATSPTPLLVIAEGALSAPIQAWLQRHAERTGVVLCQADRSVAAESPLLRMLDAAWPSTGASALQTRVAAVSDDAALDARVQIIGVDALEHEAHTVAHHVRHALSAGAESIALVAVDRMAARRARALLERDGILVEDESGWKLSTTRAAALVDVALEVLARSAYWRDVLDLCKSPFVFSAMPAEQRQRAVLAIERVIIDEHVVTGLAPIAAKLSEQPDALALISTLSDACRGFSMQPAAPQVWLKRLRALLTALDATDALLADAAGQTLLESFADHVEALHDEGCELSFEEWRDWLDGELDAALFRDRSIRSPVVMTHLPACRLRHFDVAIVVGADAVQLAAEDRRAIFVHDGVRQELGLPGRADGLQRLRDDLTMLIAGCGRVVFTWQQLRDGDPGPLAAELEILDLAHAMRFGRPLIQPAPPMPLVHATHQGQVVPGPVVPRAQRPASITAYGYASLVSCPYQYFARSVLGLDEAGEVSEAMEKRDYGQFVHAVLERFHTRFPVISDVDDDTLLAALEAETQAVFGERVKANFLETAWLLRWRKRMGDYLAWQRTREQAGWRHAESERSVRRALTLADGDMVTLKGRLDRIDRGTDGALAVLDYKARDTASLRRAVKDPEDGQLAIYAALMDEAVAQAGYVALDGDRVDTFALDDPAAAAAAHVARLTDLFERMGEGAAMIANGVGSACDYCSVRGLCRKDYHDD